MENKKEKDTPVYRDCLECRCFLWCESGKQIFHKVTEIPCDMFEEERDKECDE